VGKPERAGEAHPRDGNKSHGWGFRGWGGEGFKMTDKEFIEGIREKLQSSEDEVYVGMICVVVALAALFILGFVLFCEYREISGLLKENPASFGVSESYDLEMGFIRLGSGILAGFYLAFVLFFVIQGFVSLITGLRSGYRAKRLLFIYYDKYADRPGSSN